jgi:hypothetical protein
MRWVFIAISVLLAFHLHGEMRYKQGRVDKNAEMMEALTGNKEARIAIVTPKKVTYHPAGWCASCHKEGVK